MPEPAVVVDLLPNNMYKIDLATGQRLLAYVAGRMRLRKARLEPGDRVAVVVDTEGTRARILSQSPGPDRDT